MTAQEIQKYMTQGEWRFYESSAPNGIEGKFLGGIQTSEDYMWDIAAMWRDLPKRHGCNTANAAAITTAVNNTYGKGLDPEQYMPLRNAAAALYAKFSKEEVMTAEDFEELNNVLAKTIIEPNKVLGK